MREPLEGRLASHVLTTHRGIHQVVKLCPAEVMSAPLAELYEASLYCIGVENFHLRVLERLSTRDGDTWVLQGWLVHPL